MLSSAEYILYTTRYSSLTFGVRGEELGGVSGILVVRWSERTRGIIIIDPGMADIYTCMIT